MEQLAILFDGLAPLTLVGPGAHQYRDISFEGCPERGNYILTAYANLLRIEQHLESALTASFAFGEVRSRPRLAPVWWKDCHIESGVGGLPLPGITLDSILPTELILNIFGTEGRKRNELSNGRQKRCRCWRCARVHCRLLIRGLCMPRKCNARENDKPAQPLRCTAFAQ